MPRGDAAAWLGFLGLLKRNRPRQPINGAIVCVSISDVALMPDSERLAHARAVRQRLQELTDELGVRFPIYVLFTKADLLAGFSSSSTISAARSASRSGASPSPSTRARARPVSSPDFLREFDLLVDRLNDRVVERLHQEPDIQHRSLVYGFPAQVASMRDALHEFLTEAFRPSRYDARPVAARRLPHQRHPGGHAVRPADGRDGAVLRPGSPADDGRAVAGAAATS